MKTKKLIDLTTLLANFGGTDFSLAGMWDQMGIFAKSRFEMENENFYMVFNVWGLEKEENGYGMYNLIKNFWENEGCVYSPVNILAAGIKITECHVLRIHASSKEEALKLAISQWFDYKIDIYDLYCFDENDLMEAKGSTERARIKLELIEKITKEGDMSQAIKIPTEKIIEKIEEKLN